jgi:hypothetical protein
LATEARRTRRKGIKEVRGKEARVRRRSARVKECESARVREKTQDPSSHDEGGAPDASGHTRAGSSEGRGGGVGREWEEELGGGGLGLVLVADGGANLSHHFVGNFIELVGVPGVLGSLLQDFLFGITAGFPGASGHQIVAAKNLCHDVHSFEELGECDARRAGGGRQCEKREKIGHGDTEGAEGRKQRGKETRR